MAKSHLPIQSTTHQKEDESRTRFNDLISPWIVRHWHENDYGIDANVEITLPISKSKDRLVSGKKFEVQLKSSEASKSKSKTKSISVSVTKINYWYNSNLPTMLCYFDENEKLYFYKWIDEELINFLTNKNSKWLAQSSITINLDKPISDDLDCIQEYVYRWKRPDRSILTSGSYFNFNNEITRIIEALLVLSNKQGDKYLFSVLNELKANLSKAIYSIAIAGQSRAGKSTLINALVKKDISPVGILPTTGVPICILPGMKEECEILFEDGKIKKGKVDMAFIEQFASQKKNRRNKKKVKLISAKIINQNFERGIALYDIPGLNDPNEYIRTLSDSALLNSNAIIYVISASPMASGEFILSKEILSDLMKLKNSADKIFIVINKVDMLENEMLKELKEYLSEEFLEYKVTKFHPSPPLFLSAIHKEENLSNILSVEDLNKVLWDFLLSQKKTGLHRLFSALNQANEAINEAVSICDSRFLNTEQSKKVQRDIKDVNSELTKIPTKIKNRKTELFKYLERVILNNKNVSLNHLRNEMDKIPLNQLLYTKQVVNAYLFGEAERLSLEIQQIFGDHLVGLENEINIWIKKKLRQVQLDIKTNAAFKNTDNNHYAWLIHNHFRSKQANNFFQFILDFLASTAASAVDAIEALVINPRQKRNKDINSMYNHAKIALDGIFSSIINQMKFQFDSVAKEINDKTKERTHIYLSSLQEQLKIRETPLSNKELQKLNTYVRSLKDFQSKISSIEIQIEEHVEGMTTPKKILK